jgi:hypothetical protein
MYICELNTEGLGSLWSLARLLFSCKSSMAGGTSFELYPIISLITEEKYRKPHSGQQSNIKHHTLRLLCRILGTRHHCLPRLHISDFKQLLVGVSALKVAEAGGSPHQLIVSQSPHSVLWRSRGIIVSPNSPVSLSSTFISRKAKLPKLQKLKLPDMATSSTLPKGEGANSPSLREWFT